MVKSRVSETVVGDSVAVGPPVKTVTVVPLRIPPFVMVPEQDGVQTSTNSASTALQLSAEAAGPKATRPKATSTISAIRFMVHLLFFTRQAPQVSRSLRRSTP